MCTCNECTEVDGQVNTCCQDYVNISSCLQGTMFKCITEHPRFLSNCLDIYVLEASFYGFCQQEGPPDDDELLHETLRYLAYRRFIR